MYVRLGLKVGDELGYGVCGGDVFVIEDSVVEIYEDGVDVFGVNVLEMFECGDEGVGEGLRFVVVV